MVLNFCADVLLFLRAEAHPHLLDWVKEGVMDCRHYTASEYHLVYQMKHTTRDDKQPRSYRWAAWQRQV
jgi:hypothetical protein